MSANQRGEEMTMGHEDPVYMEQLADHLADEAPAPMETGSRVKLVDGRRGTIRGALTGPYFGTAARYLRYVVDLDDEDEPISVSDWAIRKEESR